MLYTVRDGARSLRLEGVKLADSTSKLRGKPRWIEFQLYKTAKGQYVIYRVGESIVYHAAGCKTVDRHELVPADGDTIGGSFVPCYECRPVLTNPESTVYPEVPRHYVLVCNDARGVVNALMKTDENGVEYLTKVARVLLEQAAKKDSGIADAYYTDYIQ